MELLFFAIFQGYFLKNLPLSLLSGLSLAVFGGVGLAAWFVGWHTTAVPGPDAALAFMLAAAVFLFESRPAVARVAGGLLAALGLAQALVSVFAEGLDQLSFSLTPMHLAAGFLLSGLILMLMHSVKNKWAAWLIELACLSVVLLGVFHVVDQMTGLRVMSGDLLNVSSTVTAALLGMLGLGLWFLIRRIPWYREFDIGRIDWKITAASGMVLLFIAFAAAVASFVIMGEQTERTMKDNLAHSLESRARVFQNEVNDAMRVATGVSQRNGFRNALERLSAGRDSPEVREKIVGTVTRLLDGRYNDITAAALYDARGRVLAQAGRFVTDSEFTAPLPLDQPAVLLWDQGLVLQIKLNMVEGNQRLGVLMLDVRLKEIDAMLKDRTGLGATGAVAVCAPSGDDLQCLHAQYDYRVAKILRHRNGDPLPMSHALADESGVSSNVDDRGKEVVSAYGPIDALGLGMLLEIDKAEMQQPIRARLRGMLAALAVLALVGLLLLRWQIAPLAGRLVKEVFERRRVEGELRLLQTITTEVSQAQDVRTALHVVLKRICEAAGWIFGQAWLLRLDGACLEYSPAWYGEPELESYSTGLREFTFQSGQGLPGRVWAAKKPEWLREGHIRLEPEPRRAERMRQVGFKARMGVPILADQEVVAVLEFSTRSPREEDTRLLDLATLIAGQLGNAIRRKRAEEALREGEERHRALIQNSVEAIYLFDPETKRVLECNDAFLHLLGYSQAEVLSLTIYDFVAHPRSDIDALMENLFSSSVVANSERRWRRKDGGLIDVQVSARKIRHRGRDLGFFIARDVTERKQRETELAESKRRYQALVESVDAIVWQADPDTFKFTYVSPQAERILGYPARQWLESETFWKDHLHPADREQALAYCLAATRDGRDHELEYRMIAADRRALWLRDKVTVVKQDGRPVQLHGIMLDVTAARCIEEALQESEDRYSALIQHSVEAIYFYDLESKQVLEGNPAFRRLLGYDVQEMGGLFMQDFIQHDKRSIHNFAQRIIELGDSFSIGERRWRAKDGKIIYVQVTVGQMRQRGRMVGFAIARDITEQRQAQERLTYLAHYDELTGLPNRVLFGENLSQILQEAARRRRLAAVMFMDLDRFKTINDTLGHEAGDELLKGVADRLRNCTRRGDAIARLGGDEFTLALADVAQPDDVALAAQKILDSFAHPFHIGGRDLFVTPSIGIALYPQDHRDVEGLLKNADVAMYRAKEQGRHNYQFYTQEMNAKAFERLTLEIHLRRALERQEFLLHYQPQVDLTKGTMVGVEALIRWQSPELGLVSPATFVPLAEETGLIVPIGEWVLRSACTQNKAWQEAGLPTLRISVNLSGRQFRDKNLVETVRQTLARTGLEPKYLELELTEGMLQNMDAAEAVLRELHALVVYLSVDDFGTGYSSLNYLKRFPIDNLKIDRSFVRDVTTDPDDAAITDAIISMAHTLGIRVVAEGVETREQLVFLHQHKCDLIQGYYFSKPLPAETFVELLRTGRRLTPSERLVAPDIKSASG